MRVLALSVNAALGLGLFAFFLIFTGALRPAHAAEGQTTELIVVYRTAQTADVEHVEFGNMQACEAAKDRLHELQINTWVDQVSGICVEYNQ